MPRLAPDRKPLWPNARAAAGATTTTIRPAEAARRSRSRPAAFGAAGSAAAAPREGRRAASDATARGRSRCKAAGRRGRDDDRPARSDRPPAAIGTRAPRGRDDDRRSAAAAVAAHEPAADRRARGRRRAAATAATTSAEPRARSRSAAREAARTPQGRRPRAVRPAAASSTRRGAPCAATSNRKWCPTPKRPVLRTGQERGAGAAKSEAARHARQGAGRRRHAAGGARPRLPTSSRASRVANATRAQDQLAKAAEAYTAGRERDAARLLRPLRDAYPDAAAVRELLGLVHYRLGQYPAATKELAAFADLTGSVEQHPVLMDCWRAQRRYRKVEALWDELATASPSAALVTEGRIVLAGASPTTAGSTRRSRRSSGGRDDVKRVQEHHLRLWYALGRPLRTRRRDPARAASCSNACASTTPSFADVAERLAASR